MNLLAELKRRNVIRMAGLYLVGAWLIVQVGETLLPLYDTPAWVMKTLIALLAMGFVPAVVFSWLYELTPDGLKRDSGMLADNPVALRTARRLDQLTLVGVVALLAVIAADRFWPRAGPGSTSVATTIDSATGASRASPLPVSDDETAPPPEKSIAVLPFVNMSADADNEYFSDGISEEILNALARSSDLHVAARTSSFAFKGKSLEVPEIARELELGMILRLGPGELRSGGHARDSILADAVEAIIAAVYLDGGMDEARALVRRLLGGRLTQPTPETRRKDPKTRLQEHLQAVGRALPQYQVVDIKGDQHDQTFRVRCSTGLADDTVGEGPSRRKAEQAAARKMLECIGEQRK